MYVLSEWGTHVRPWHQTCPETRRIFLHIDGFLWGWYELIKAYTPSHFTTPLHPLFTSLHFLWRVGFFCSLTLPSPLLCQSTSHEALTLYWRRCCFLLIALPWWLTTTNVFLSRVIHLLKLLLSHSPKLPCHAKWMQSWHPTFSCYGHKMQLTAMSKSVSQ